MKKFLLVIACAMLQLSVAAQAEKHDSKYHKPIKIEKQWKKFNPGQVKFEIKSPEAEGAKIYQSFIKDPEKYIGENALRVVQTLYWSPEDVHLKRLKTIYYSVEDYDGISEESGRDNGLGAHIRYSTRWIERNYKDKDIMKVDYETRGVIYHELTHAYQLSPKGCGTYDGKSEYWSFIEGMADGVRVSCGTFSQDFKSKDRPRGGSWRSGYRIGGYFLYWLTLKKDPDFLRKFNLSAIEVNPWSWDKACKHILGEENGVEKLWREYMADLGEEVGELPKADEQPQANERRREMPQPKVLSYEESPNRGKSVAIFGGSFSVIPESDEAKNFWAEKLDVKIKNYGIGGAGFSKRTGEDRWIPGQIDRALASGEQYDIWVIWASTNDVNNKVDIDEQNKILDECIKKIKAERPEAKIMMLTSLPVPMLQHMQNIGDYVAGQQRVCWQNKVPCLDLFRQSGINAYNAPDYFQGDKLHLNRDGYRHIRELTARFIGSN